MVLPRFVQSALKNEPITIYGEGNQTRSFCYVSDLIEGFVRLMFSNQEVTGPINLGSPHEFTMLELAERVISTTNSNSKIAFHKLPQDDPKQRRPDISKARKILNWNPTINLEEGLALTSTEFTTRI